MELKQGETYEISHSRKGRFTAVLRSDPAEESIDLEIVKGEAAMMSSPNAEVGETIRVRKDFCHFYPSKVQQ